MRGPRAEMSDETLLAVRFRAQLQDLLLQEQVHGERSCDNEREWRGLLTVGVLRIVLKDQCVAGFVEFDEFSSKRGVGRRVAVFEVAHGAFCEGVLLE